MPSSNASWTCRIDWRPSRWLAAALTCLGLMAALSLGLSALPAALALPGAVLAAGWGAWLARRQLQRPPCSLDWLGGDEPAYLTQRDGLIRIDAVTVRLRGPQATLAGTDRHGRIHRLAWWPDTLPPQDRRQLRLALAVSWRYVKPLRKQAA
ncbi:MAG: hypothetical protein K0M70_00845 [Arenimonas sp.]|uniref:hypothetical protein n=1 Tax=Arenimonas sp. TaxID=1872635 RepID=UPI0025C08598|nr:hypothetical protein [Arenimonas sp.]MBW8366395.1 hypothetical protein [Arenimonas sp.]